MNAARTASRYAAIAIILYGLLCSRGLAARWEPLPEGWEVTSPDGRFVVRVTENYLPTPYDPHPMDKEPCLSIEDRSKHTTTLTGGLAPFFSMVWTKDSRSIVTVGHIAGGSYAEVFHYHDGRWQGHDVEPFSEGRTGHYAVVGLGMDSDRFRVTFKVADDTAGQAKVVYYLRTLEVDAATGAVLQAGPRRAISYDAYGRLFLRRRAGPGSSR